jgi:hypothetical protein
MKNFSASLAIKKNANQNYIEKKKKKKKLYYTLHIQIHMTCCYDYLIIIMFVYCGQVTVAQVCNPSYLGGWAQENPGSRSVWASSLWDSHLQNNQGKTDWRKKQIKTAKSTKQSWALVAHTYNPSYLGQRSGGSCFQATLGK